MGELPKLENSEPENLRKFREEITRLKKEEGAVTVHFFEINPEELGEREMEIYNKLVSEDLSSEEFNSYRDDIRKTGNVSQKYFASYVANKMTIQMEPGLMDDDKSH